MSNISITLDPVSLREATVQAVMGVLTPEIRAEILEKAISALLKPSTNSWDRDKSPIQVAFDQAVTHVAQQEANRLVTEDPVMSEKIRALMRTTAEKVISMDTEKLSSRMADAFISSLRRD